MVLFLALCGCTADPAEDSGESASGVQLSAVQTCTAPVPVAYTAHGEGFIAHEDPDAVHANGGGLVIEDLDADGNLDLMVFFRRSAPGLYLGDGQGGFTEVLEVEAMSGRPVLLDLDLDGSLDILTSAHIGLISDGAGGFVLEEQAVSTDKSYALRPADLDADGFTDLFQLRSSSEQIAEEMHDAVIRGSAEGFTPDEGTLSEAAARQGFDAIAVDWDGDHDLDIYAINDMGHAFGGNVLWRNDGGALTEATAGCDCGVVMSGMGGSVGDYNRDGALDLYLTATEFNVLLAGQGDGTMVDMSAVARANPLHSDAEMGWGSAWLDHDNDGDLDILTVQGDLWGESGEVVGVPDAPIHLLSQDDGMFADVAAAVGLSPLGSFRAAAAAELNGDGVLDVVVTQVTGHPWVFLSQGCSQGAWLEVEAPEHSEVVVEAGGRTHTAVVLRGTGFAVSGPQRVWIGLGDAERVERLTITTLDGTVSSATDFAPRRRVSALP